MIAPFYIELLTRHGAIKERHQFRNLPISIGRGYDNELILDDRYIAAHHAIIEQTEAGDLIMRDLGSKNGVFADGKRHTTLVLDGHKTVRLGHSSLRVRGADFNVEQELTDKTAYGWEGWPPGLLGVSIITLLSVIGVWLANTSKFSFVPYLLAISLVLSLVVVWSGCWAFANRVIGSHARFGRHIFIVACALLAMDLWDLFSSLISYAYSFETLTRYGNHVSMAIAAGMVFFHLMTINSEHPKRFATVCTVLALLGSGLILISNDQRYGRLSDQLYMTHIMPPAVRQSADQTVPEFLSDVTKLKGKLDEERLKPVLNNSLLGDDE